MKNYPISEKENKQTKVVCYIFSLFIFLLLLLIVISNLKFGSDINEVINFGNEGQKWNLVFIVVPSQDKKDIWGYGYIFDFGDYKSNFFYVKHEQLRFKNSILNWTNKGLEINNMSFVLEEGDELLFKWNEKNIGSDKFLDTFKGFDSLRFGIMKSADDSTYRAIILNEEISADMSKLQSLWKEETFIFLKNDTLSLIGLKYDNYMDGILKINKEEYSILDVVRSNDDINILFSEGIIKGQCKKHGTYRIYESSGAPEETVISCNLEVLFNDSRRYLFDDVFGQMEIL